MEQDNSHSATPRPTRINPPGEARVTTMLNNVGNGLMLGAAPVLARNLYDHVTGRVLTRPQELLREKWGFGLAVTGAVLGVVLGEVEGRRLQAYRNKMSDQMALQDERIAQTQAELAATKAELKSWKEKTHTRKESHHEASVGA